MDKFDRERFADAYRALADVFERDRPHDNTEDQLPYLLGDLMKRIFVGSQYDPPDEILEASAVTMRSGSDKERHAMAERLRRHADHLDELANQESG